MAYKQTHRHSDPVRRLLCLTETCFLERDPSTYSIGKLSKKNKSYVQTGFKSRVAKTLKRSANTTFRSFWDWWRTPFTSIIILISNAIWYPICIVTLDLVELLIWCRSLLRPKIPLYIKSLLYWLFGVINWYVIMTHHVTPHLCAKRDICWMMILCLSQLCYLKFLLILGWN